MDSHVFRLIALELADFLRGARIERIRSPGPGLLVLGVYNLGVKRNIVLRHKRIRPPGQQDSMPLKLGAEAPRAEPCLYWSELKLPNPENPSSLVMHLRKHLSGLILGGSRLDWVQRRLVLTLRLPPDRRLASGPACFVLDLQEGPYLCSEIPCELPPVWPDPALIRDAAHAFPVLTPPLRRTLLALNAPEAAALLADLAHDSKQESGSLYVYTQEGQPQILSAWPLPDPLREGLREETALYREARGVKDNALLPKARPENFPCLEAARRVYEPRILAFLGLRREEGRLREEKNSRRRLSNALRKLDAEEERLRGLLALRDQAILLQGCLWKYGREKLAELRLGAEETPSGKALRIPLDAGSTLRQNMDQMFRLSARGARGLAFVAERRRKIAAELNQLESEGLIPDNHGSRQDLRQSPRKTNSTGKQPAGSRVAHFISSDGFLLLRGRSAEGNRELLKLAQPHDLWLHVQGGASAHVVIRRAHAGMEIPERTLHEAGTLSALKSWRKQDNRAEIISAWVKDVQANKGGTAGSVLLRRQQKSFMVELDPNLEIRLLERIPNAEKD